MIDLSTFSKIKSINSTPLICFVALVVTELPNQSSNVSLIALSFKHCKYPFLLPDKGSYFCFEDWDESLKSRFVEKNAKSGAIS